MAGTWRAIQDPSPTTIDIHPSAFGVKSKEIKALLKPQVADNISGEGISFKQAAGQPDYSATRIEWGDTVKETIALNKKNGVNLELVRGDDGKYFLGIKDIWSDGYHRVDRNSVVMHYGDYTPTPENYVAANPEWVKANANPDGTVKDCAVVANDKGAKILENSYVTANGEKINFDTMAPGTKVHKDPNAVVNAVAYDAPRTLKTLEGNIVTDVTMGDVDGNVYNNFKQLKKQITKGQLVANDSDPNSAKFIELVKAGNDTEAIKLLRQVTKITSDNALIEKIIKFKGQNGKPLLTREDAIDLIKQCQAGWVYDGKPIPNYRDKIEAVLSNPEEVKLIERWKSKVAGIWRAIQDPSPKTVDLHPRAFEDRYKI